MADQRSVMQAECDRFAAELETIKVERDQVQKSFGDQRTTMATLDIQLVKEREEVKQLMSNIKADRDAMEEQLSLKIGSLADLKASHEQLQQQFAAESDAFTKELLAVTNDRNARELEVGSQGRVLEELQGTHKELRLQIAEEIDML